MINEINSMFKDQAASLSVYQKQKQTKKASLSAASNIFCNKDPSLIEWNLVITQISGSQPSKNIWIYVKFMWDSCYPYVWTIHIFILRVVRIKL